MAIHSTAEVLSSVDRQLIEQYLRGPVYDYYGSRDAGAIAGECRARNGLHVFCDLTHVEVLREDGSPCAAGETGEVVVTNLHEHAMPLIRYRTGDLAVFADRECACGRKLPVIETLLGRSDDVVVTPDGRRVGRLDPIFKAVSSFYESRIVQDAADHVRVEYVADTEVPPAERATLLTELRNRLGPSMRIDVVRVTAIPRTRRGKLRMVVNEMTS